jgi:sortase A
MRNTLLRYFGRALILAGALALGWSGEQRFEMFRVQRASSRRFDADRNAVRPSARTDPDGEALVPPKPGDSVARLEIPRLNVSVMVLEGTSPAVLRVAAGHIQGTALPGTTGNVGIAAHRDTFFRPLLEIRRNDEIVVTEPGGATLRYRVDTLEIVGPEDVRVLQSTGRSELTLVTCYPFSYIGSAPKRFVVHAGLAAAL